MTKNGLRFSLAFIFILACFLMGKPTEAAVNVKITEISPEYVQAGDIVTIKGEHFGDQPNGVIPALEIGSPNLWGTVTNWSDSEITYQVGGISERTKLTMKVYDYDLSQWVTISSPHYLYPYPYFSNLSLGNGVPGDAITIEGGALISQPQKVYFDGVSAPIISWSAGEAKVTVPALTSGPRDVSVWVEYTNDSGLVKRSVSQTFHLEKTYSEKITSVSPSTSSSGQTVVLQGSNLSSSYQVAVGKGLTPSGGSGTLLEPLSATSNSITFKIPYGSSSLASKEQLVGSYDVALIDKATGISIAILPNALQLVKSTKITSITPKNVVPGQVITLTGTKLSGVSSVYLLRNGGATPCTVSNSTETSLNFTIPQPTNFDNFKNGVYDVLLLGENDTIAYDTMTAAIVFGDSASVTSTPISSDLKDYGVTQNTIEGSLVKTKDSTTVYLVRDGKRYSFPNQHIYKSWYGDSFSGVNTITADELAQYRLTGNITYKPGSLIKIPSIPKVYLVTDDGKLRWIPTEEKFKALGLSFGNVEDLSEGFFFSYSIGSDI